MSRILGETDANANLPIVESHSEHGNQKASSRTPENRITAKVDNVAAPANESPTSAEEVFDQEKETVIQEVLRYMLGHIPSVASSSQQKAANSDHQLRLSPSASSFPVYQSLPSKHVQSAALRKKKILVTVGKDKKSRKEKTVVEKKDGEQRESLIKKLLEDASRPTTSVAFTTSTYLSSVFEKEETVPSKHTEQFWDSSNQHSCKTHVKSFGEKYPLDNPLCLDDKESKGVAKTTSFPTRRSRYRERKRFMQQLQSDETDRFISQQQHRHIKPQSAIARAGTYLTSGTHYWPRVLLSSCLNVLISRIQAENKRVR